MTSASNFSLMKCRSISICFVRSCCTGFSEIWMVALLSLMTLLGSCGGYPISVSSFHIYNTLVIPLAIPRNSASALERATTFCFLLHPSNKVPTNLKACSVLAGISSEYIDKAKALASSNRFPLAILAIGYLLPLDTFFLGNNLFGGLLDVLLGGKLYLPDVSSCDLSFFFTVVAAIPSCLVEFFRSVPVLAAEALPLSSPRFLLPFLWPSFHQSGLKVCSLSPDLAASPDMVA
ncbi:hypothetical protein Tco_1058831 [Tanacetum coccineum]